MSMLLDLSRLRGGGGRIDRRDPPEAFDATNEDFRVVAPVVLGADVRKDRGNVRIVGRLTGELELSCSRCLEPFRIPVDSAFDLLYLPASTDAAAAPDEDHQLEDEDANVSFYEDETIDLAHLVREQFYLALPMKPLCRPDCQGLCPVCGTNRNVETCACDATWVDPRMEALRRLRETKTGH
ncbi:MAG: hypothetical protein ABS36_05905 [Acidobacteria bacterium SCN 69-37]|nr:MAG: hypothetical protein ABS36_05905 [Acidobacteria bacterium SCN 69-37]